MAHRIMAVLILAGVAFSALVARRRFGWKNTLSKMTLGWVILIVAQAILGAATIWSDKAADVATAHVLMGALSLASGTVISLTAWRAVSVEVESESGAVRNPSWACHPRPTSAPELAPAKEGIAPA
jgi:heme A synthase